MQLIAFPHASHSSEGFFFLSTQRWSQCNAVMCNNAGEEGTTTGA